MLLCTVLCVWRGLVNCRLIVSNEGVKGQKRMEKKDGNQIAGQK